MCGYLIYKEKPSATTLKKHLEVNKHRGTDGYGVIGISSGIHYSALHLSTFLKDWDIFGKDAGGYIVHHRKASIGGINSALVHPLVHESVEGTVKIMQNGTRAELASLFYAASDSAALAQVWHGISDDCLYLILEGCGVVFAHDSKDDKLYFHKDESRTLYYNQKLNMYASEPVVPCTKWQAVSGVCLLDLSKDMKSWRVPLKDSLETWKVCSNNGGRITRDGQPVVLPFSYTSKKDYRKTRVIT